MLKKNLDRFFHSLLFKIYTLKSTSQLTAFMNVKYFNLPPKAIVPGALGMWTYAAS